MAEYSVLFEVLMRKFISLYDILFMKANTIILDKSRRFKWQLQHEVRCTLCIISAYRLLWKSVLYSYHPALENSRIKIAAISKAKCDMHIMWLESYYLLGYLQLLLYVGSRKKWVTTLRSKWYWNENYTVEKFVVRNLLLISSKLHYEKFYNHHTTALCHSSVAGTSVSQ